jgi:polyisoprenoid-binding protein YceI
MFALHLFTLFFAGIALAQSAPPARQITFDPDPGASEIKFDVGATLHTVRGTFAIKEGSLLRLDVASGAIDGRVLVDVRTGRTGNDERDQRMHREVLESAQFPEAMFLPRRLEGNLTLTGQSQVSVRGILRLHGQDHDVTLPVKVSIQDSRFTATSHLSIPYVGWGMKDPSNVILRVSKTVELDLRIAGTVRHEP